MVVMIHRLLVIGLLVCLPVWGLYRSSLTVTAQTAPQPRVHANMLQLMRGVLYPPSNVIFTVQSDDPASFKPSARPATSSDPLTAAYGGWAAVENSGLALAESANLLIIPRPCANGRPAPVRNADWQMWVEELRDAGMAAYKLGQTKNADGILDVAAAVSDSCLHCHQKYRQGQTRCQS